MSIDVNRKLDKINSFINEKYFPLLKAYEISEDNLKTIIQNIVNKCNDFDFIVDLDEDDYHELIDMATNGGIVYKDENGSKYEDINEAFIFSTIGSMALLGEKNGVDMGEYNIGNPNTLYNHAQEQLANYDREDYIMFFTGNAKAFNNKHDNAFGSESAFEIIDDEILYEEPSLEDITPSLTEQKKKLLEDKKEAVSSFREQLDDLSIDDLKPKTL